MVLFATKLAGNAVNLEESRIKKWKEVASLVTSFETLDPAIPKDPYLPAHQRHLTGEDPEAQRGDENDPKSCHQGEQVLELEPRSF